MPRIAKKTFSISEIRDAALRFKILGHATRLGIVGALAKCSLILQR
jgi:hypothetical protein